MSETLAVRVAVAPMHAEARISSPQVSQRLAGHEVRVLAGEGEWVRVCGDDAYEGWMHRGYLGAPAPSLTTHLRRLSLGVTVTAGAGGPARALPLGAWLGEGDRIVSGSTVEASALADAFPRDATAIAATAVERFAGTPYQWGGVSPWGADCSGLVQTTFWLHGIQLPRDAWQQAEVGAEVTAGPEGWQPADLAFFTDRADRRITHVGIALGDGQMVHLALGRGGHAVERLDRASDASDGYAASLASRLVGVRRIL